MEWKAGGRNVVKRREDWQWKETGRREEKIDVRERHEGRERERE